MNNIERRDFLRYGAASAAFSMLGTRLASAAPKRGRPQKLIVIFGRGGNDSLNTFIPHGDADYANYRSAAGLGGSTIAIPPTQSIAMPTTSYVRAHPALQPIVDRMNLGRGAVLGRVGNDDCKRSHFTEMRIIETGRPGSLATLLSEGWGARFVDGLGLTTDLKGVSHTTRGQRLLFSQQPDAQMPAINRIYDDAGVFLYNIPPSGLTVAQLEGAGTQGWRGHTVDTLTNLGAQSNFTQVSGASYFASRDVLAPPGLPVLTHDAARFPRTGPEVTGSTNAALAAVGPFNLGMNLLAQLEESMHVLENTDAVVCGLDLGAFDTHGDQLTDQERLLAYLAHGMASCDELAQLDTAADYMILFVTEFGRTVRSNGNNGTDHGVGTAYIALGDRVRAGVYNMTDPALPLNGYGQHWKPLRDSFVNPTQPTNLDYNAVYPASDFRAVFVEILAGMFGLSNTQLEAVFPGLNAAITANPALFARLGFVV